VTTLDDALEGMDPDVRPQDDLFGHVNGRWLAEAEIPADRSTWGPFTQLADEAEAHVRDIITDLAEGGTEGVDDPAEAAMIADLYASFMDTATVDRRGHRPIRPILRAVDGLGDTRDLTAFLGEFERVGGVGLFGSYVATDAGDPDRNLLHLLQGGLGLPDESYYREEKFAEAREKYVEYVATMLRLVDDPDPEGAAARVLALDTALAGGHWARAETRDVQKTYNLMTLEELTHLAPSVDWVGWATNLGGGRAAVAEVVVKEPSFFAHLSSLLEEVPLDRWQEWLRTRILRSAAPYLPEPFVRANFELYGRTLAGTPELRERWKRAVSFVEGAVGEAVGKVYVARHFPPESKAMMDDLVANLLEAYRRSITDLDWMTESTKERAFEKLGTFLPKIGYPDEFRDYADLTVRRSDLMGNVAAAAAFETDRQLAKIGSPVDRREWLMLPQTVNAYYLPGTNEICFPAGILQKPFFSPEAHPAENYGGIGAVIGHEIGHGFDDQGSQYDSRGALSNWWTSDDRAAFEQKAKALVVQYDGFSPRSMPEERVNGQLTVGENIGDLGGLTIGHLAYLISQGGEADPEDRRRLFLSWGYVWRTKRRPELERQLLSVDPHSPSEFRANIVRNLDEFHEVFGTRPGDGLWLDPGERVRIW
jgi:putative endopeptidase